MLAAGNSTKQIRLAMPFFSRLFATSFRIDATTRTVSDTGKPAGLPLRRAPRRMGCGLLDFIRKGWRFMPVIPPESIRSIGVLLHSGRFKDAHAQLEKLVSENPDYVEGLRLLAG